MTDLSPEAASSRTGPATQPAPTAHAAQGEASSWVRRWGHLVGAGASVLDVACGSGRHVRWFAARGCRVTALDRDAAAIEGLRGVAAEACTTDLEGDAAWPPGARVFDAVVCTNYLHRPLLPRLAAAVAVGGVLIYETFAAGNESVGRPSNPAFLLRPGELLAAFEGLRPIAFEDGFASGPDRFVQRLVAVREDRSAPGPTRWALPSEGHGAPAKIDGSEEHP